MAGKVEKVMGEYKSGELKSSSGQKVKSRAQAIAIGLSEARRAGEKVSPKPKDNPGHGAPSYEKGGVVSSTGHAIVHKGEIVLPARAMEPATPEDSSLSDEHLHDSVAFNMRHATDHIGMARKAADKLAERGQEPRTGNIRNALDAAMGMGLSHRDSPYEDGGASPSEHPENDIEDPVSMRKRMGRAAATAAVKDRSMPRNYTKGRA